MTDTALPTFTNPDTVAPPIGPYSHVAQAPAGARVVAFAGQVGNAPDGSLPDTVEEQFANALRNIVRLLESVGATPAHLIKLNTYLVRAVDLPTLGAARAAILGDARPASTLVYVPRLAAEQYLVEVEAWAVAP